MKKRSLIAVDGPSGSGRTMQTRNLHGQLATLGVNISCHQELNGSEIGSLAGKIVAREEIDPVAKMFFKLGDRFQRITDVVRPFFQDSEEEGDSVLVMEGSLISFYAEDLFSADESLLQVYQGQLKYLLKHRLLPHLIVVLDTGSDPRIKRRFVEQVGFWNSRCEYNDIDSRAVIVNGDGRVDEVWERVWEATSSFLGLQDPQEA
jgi:thymidylate kinase